jgi:hypothetical protein
LTEAELIAAFAEIRAQPAPPSGLTPQAMLGAGRSARRRRRIVALAGGTMVAAATAVTVMIGLPAGSDTPPSVPIPPAEEPLVTPTPAITRPPTPSPVEGGHTPPTPLDPTTPVTSAPPTPDRPATSIPVSP